LLEAFPIWSDVTTFDGEPWRGIVDVISGGFPCQDISCAGKGAGIEGSRSGMWSEMARIICEVRPRYAFIENVPALITRGLDRVLTDLAKMGYVGRYGCMGGGAVNSVCEGERLWIVATKADSAMLEGVDIQKYFIASEEESRRWEYTRAVGKMLSQDDYTRIKRDSDAVSRGMDRLKAIGNAQNRNLAALAFNTLKGVR